MLIASPTLMARVLGEHGGGRGAMTGSAVNAILVRASQPPAKHREIRPREAEWQAIRERHGLRSAARPTSSACPSNMPTPPLAMAASSPDRRRLFPPSS
jgi:hypothetical protein